jgi:hypothetical protein
MAATYGTGMGGNAIKRLIFGVKGLLCDIALAKSVGIAQQKTFSGTALAFVRLLSLCFISLRLYY